MELIKNGLAYRCFCSKMRLDLLRKECSRRNEHYKYDGRCRLLSQQQADQLVQQGEPHCVRVKLSEEPLACTDLVFGEQLNCLERESDFVILKVDGQATYHLANVVDDHLMDVTHVLRGSEWLSSTPKHLLLYRTFGWQPPQYAHLPLIMHSDGTKLSKRHQHSDIRYLRRAGYSARALMNLVLCGGVADHDPSACYSLPELIDKFSLEEISRRSSQADPERLKACSLQDLQRSLTDPADAHSTVAHLQQLVLDKYGQRARCGMVTPELVSQVLERCLAAPVDRLSQLVEDHHSYLWTLPDSLSQQTVSAQTAGLDPVPLVRQVSEAVSAVEPYTKDAIMQALKQVQTRLSIKPGTAMKLLRLLLCDGKKGPGIADLLQVLGREESLQRLRLVEETLLLLSSGGQHSQHEIKHQR